MPSPSCATLASHSEIRTYRRRAFDRSTRYQLHVEVDQTAAETLREAGVLSARGAPLERPPKHVVGRSCCRGAYLRGALLGGGTLSGPKAAHLELGRAARTVPSLLADVASREDVAVQVAERRTHAIAYAKGVETIADLLALAGASETALRLDEHAVVAATRSDANRLANADEANVKRTVLAAQRQLEAIRQLDLDSLPTKLKEIAVLRTKHPSLSLTELATKCRPQITKAAAHHRMAVLHAACRGAGFIPAPTTTKGVALHYRRKKLRAKPRTGISRGGRRGSSEGTTSPSV